MEINNHKCPICLLKIEHYICNFGACPHHYCFQCILQWLFQNFTCPMDRNKINYFEVKNLSDNKVLFKDNTFTDFQSLKKLIKADINIEKKEFLNNLRQPDPGLFWISNNQSEGLFDTEKMKKIFQKYGDLASITEKENCCYIHFFDVIKKHKMMSDIKRKYFQIEEFDIESLHYIC